MRQKGFSLGLVAVALLLAGCSERKITAPSSTLDLTASVERHDRKPDCEDVRGAFVFTSFAFTGPTTAVGAGTVRGDLSGTFAAEYFDIAPQADGVINMHAHHTITRRRGTIMTSDEIRLFPDPDPAWVQPRSRLEVTGGTGAYEGATGLLLTDGRVNLNVVPPAGSIQIRGQLCVPEAERDGDR
jgi:hypothetical protein